MLDECERLETHRHFPLQRSFQMYSSAPRDTVSSFDLLPVFASVQLTWQNKCERQKRAKYYELLGNEQKLLL